MGTALCPGQSTNQRTHRSYTVNTNHRSVPTIKSEICQKKTDRLQNEYLFFLRLLQNESVRASLSFGGMVKVLSRHKILLPAVPEQRKPSSAPCPRAVSVWRCRSLCRPRCPPPGRSRRRRRTRGPPARRPKGCPAARPRPPPRGAGAALRPRVAVIAGAFRLLLFGGLGVLLRGQKAAGYGATGKHRGVPCGKG